ncbi:MAG: recombinase family protein [Pseudomonadota bacterium]
MGSDGVTYGYARVSTDDQDLALQIAALTKEGIPERLIFSEHASGSNMKRKSLQDLLTRYLRQGDTLVVWKLDRLGRDLKGVLETIEDLDKRGIEFVSLTERFDTSTPMGRAFMQIALVFAELERNMVSERTKTGMAAQKAAGRRFGRLPLIWHDGRGSAKRIAFLRGLEAAGELRDRQGAGWVLIPKAKDLMADLNKAKNMGPNDREISNPETVRRWQREGFQGLSTDEQEEPSAGG